MASMLEKLGAMFEDDTTSVSISADVSVSEGSEVEEIESAEEVQEYAEASEVVEEASQQLEEATQQVEDTAEAVETAAELRANISQYGINKQAAALIYQFYGIDKIGSFVTPSVESIDTVGRNYSAANQLMTALEEAEEKSDGMLKRAWAKVKEWAEKFWEAAKKFVSAIGTRVRNWLSAFKQWAMSGVDLMIPGKVKRLIAGGQLQRVSDKLNRLQQDKNAKIEDVQQLEAEMNKLAYEYAQVFAADNANADYKLNEKDAEKADTGAIAKFVSVCWDIVSYIPKKIGQFIEWIKNRWNKVSREVSADMRAESAKEEKDDAKKAGFFSRTWTSMLRIMKTVFRFFFSWGAKAEKKVDKEIEEKTGKKTKKAKKEAKK